MNNREVIFLGGGLALGLVSGMLIMRGHLKDKYERIAQEEIDSVKQRYRLLRKEGLENPRDSISIKGEVESNYHEALNDLGYTREGSEDDGMFADSPPGVPIPPRDNSKQDQELDLSDDDEWDWLLSNRDPSKPYIISVDEYMLENDHFDKETLAYYEEDDTLCDTSDRPIDDPESVVGNDPLLRFGTGSGDKNIVYVRNESTSVDYEIIRDERAYTEVVLGLRDRDSGPMKFREDD